MCPLIFFHQSCRGYFLYELKDQSLMEDYNKISESFLSIDKASEALSLIFFEKHLLPEVEFKPDESCKDFPEALHNWLEYNAKESTFKLCLADPKLAAEIQEKYKQECIADYMTEAIVNGISIQSNNFFKIHLKEKEQCLINSLNDCIRKNEMGTSAKPNKYSLRMSVRLMENIDRLLFSNISKLRDWCFWFCPNLVGLVPKPKNVHFIQILRYMANELLTNGLPENATGSLEGMVIDLKDIINVCDKFTKVIEGQNNKIEYIRHHSKNLAPEIMEQMEILISSLKFFEGETTNLSKDARNKIMRNFRKEVQPGSVPPEKKAELNQKIDEYFKLERETVRNSYPDDEGNMPQSYKEKVEKKMKVLSEVFKMLRPDDDDDVINKLHNMFTEKPEPHNEKPEPHNEKSEPPNEKPEPHSEKPEPSSEKPQPHSEKPELPNEKPEPQNHNEHENRSDMGIIPLYAKIESNFNGNTQADEVSQVASLSNQIGVLNLTDESRCDYSSKQFVTLNNTPPDSSKPLSDNDECKKRFRRWYNSKGEMVEEETFCSTHSSAFPDFNAVESDDDVETDSGDVEILDETFVPKYTINNH